MASLPYRLELLKDKRLKSEFPTQKVFHYLKIVAIHPAVSKNGNDSGAKISSPMCNSKKTVIKWFLNGFKMVFKIFNFTIFIGGLIVIPVKTGIYSRKPALTLF